jgi:hypothetical protein
MTTITTDYGTFEADTEKQALALARKAKAAHAKDKERQDRDRDTARLRAEAVAYRVLCRKAEGSEFPGGWTYHAADEQHMPWKLVLQPTMSYGVKPVITWSGEHGTATSEHYGYRFLGAVMNGAGWPIVVFLQEVREGGEIEVYALGFEADQYAFAKLPGVTADEFKQSRHLQPA